MLWRRRAPCGQVDRLLEGTGPIWRATLFRILINWSSNVVRTLDTFHGVDMRFYKTTTLWLLIGQRWYARKYVLSVSFCSKISMSRRIPKELLALRNCKFDLFGGRGIIVGLQRGESRVTTRCIFGLNLRQFLQFALATHMLLLIVGLQHLVRTCPAASQSFFLPSLLVLIVK